MKSTMHKEIVQSEEIRLLGIQVRTNNKQEYNKLDGKIFPLVQRYFHESLADLITQRKKPGTTFCAYTEYESDYQGDYTYFIGEEVTQFESVLPEGFKSLVIPAQRYARFTTGPAPMPDVLANAWQQIWTMDSTTLGGQRRYHTDFEIYDERASDHQNIVMDIYIGLNDSQKA